jgi:hypothetical protein
MWGPPPAKQRESETERETPLLVMAQAPNAVAVAAATGTAEAPVTSNTMDMVDQDAAGHFETHGLLLLSSHAGQAVVKMHPFPKTYKEWSYIELSIGNAADGFDCQYDGNFFQHGEFVFDVTFAAMEVGNTVNLVKGPGGSGCSGFHTTRKAGGCRDFVLHLDGSVSPKNAMHLVLGKVKGDRLGLVKTGDREVLR